MTLVSKKRIQSASGISKNGFGSKMPALLTRMSVAATAPVRALQPASVATSATFPRTFAPGAAALITSTAWLTVSCFLPLTHTLAPVESFGDRQADAGRRAGDEG